MVLRLHEVRHIANDEKLNSLLNHVLQMRPDLLNDASKEHDQQTRSSHLELAYQPACCKMKCEEMGIAMRHITTSAVANGRDASNLNEKTVCVTVEG